MQKKNYTWLLLGLLTAIILDILALGFLHVGAAAAHYTYHCENQDCIEISPSATPEITITPTPTETPNLGGPGDGLSDGKSDGLSSCPKCTQAPDAPSPYDGARVGWK